MRRRKGIDTKFEITGYKYSESPSYYNWDNAKKYPYYEEVEKKEFHAKGVTSLDEGEKWLLTNHPDYYFGGSVCEKYVNEPPKEEKEALDFLILAVPSYYEGIYQTADRKHILNEIAKEKGVVIDWCNLNLNVEEQERE